MKYYLRVEAVNFDSFIGDTSHLSVRRGAGLLLLDSISWLEGKFSQQLVPIEKGASSGLFEVKLREGETPEKIRKSVAQALADNELLRHATFAVEIQKAGAYFASDSEALKARNAWRQWIQPTVVLPDRAAAGADVCEVDHVRPAGHTREMRGDAKFVSTSVAMRRDYGLERKGSHLLSEDADSSRSPRESFYFREAGWAWKHFAHDLSDLCSRPGHLLNGKMAVIHIDGNSFGALRQASCQNAGQLHDFSAKLTGFRRQALQTLLNSTRDDAQWLSPKGGLRIETLLWGGDEMIWVVPAWKGWEVLERFFTESQPWQIGDGRDRVRLSHCAGLVFCHHKAPIHRIVRLVESLTEAAKKGNPSVPHGGGPQQIYEALENSNNLFQYLVLESFDHIGSGLEAFRRRQWKTQGWETLRADRMPELRENFIKLKTSFPKGKVVAGVLTALGDRQSTMAEFRTRLQETLPAEVFHELAELETDFLAAIEEDKAAQNSALWLHLADLWDYMPEQEPE